MGQRLAALLASVLALTALIDLALPLRGTAEASTAQDADELVSRGEIEEIIRAYLMENPAVVVDALNQYQADILAAAEAARADAARDILPTLMSGAAGRAIGASAEEATILVAEFSDYHCGFCKQAADFVLALPEEDPGVRVVIHELPIIHPQSREVALAALTLPDDEDFATLHQALMAHTGLISAEMVPDIAAEAGLDADAVRTAVTSEDALARAQAQVETTFGLAESLGLDGTPSFVIATPDGEIVRVVVGYDENALQEALNAVKSG